MNRLPGSWRWTATAFVLVFVAVYSFNGCGARDPKFKLYVVEGERLYLTHCSNCHQPDGQGLGLVYPPLASSDFMDKNFEKVICSMKFGLKERIVVNGEVYQQPMPGVSALTELEVAEIATYIYNSWGHNRGMIDVKDMGAVLLRCDSINLTY
ncbi:MAG: cytochrome c [Cytophagales bacterium]|nr:cytochrome c [Cytophagales bacterium]